MMEVKGIQIFDCALELRANRTVLAKNCSWITVCKYGQFTDYVDM